MDLKFKKINGDLIELGENELYWRPSAYVIVQNEKGEFLTIKSAFTGNLMLPGGGMEIDESIQETAARECLEETGYTVEVSEDVVDCIESLFYDDKKNKKFYHSVGVVCRAKIVEGSEVKKFTDEREVLSVHWVDLKTTDLADWHHYYQPLIEKLRKV